MKGSGLMTNAYDRVYLLHARQVLGRMLDFACHGLGYSARDFWEMFLASGVAAAFGSGEVRYIAGMSGYELAYEILDRCGEKYRRVVDPVPPDGKSPEFWAAWSVAHYQWFRGLDFARIEAVASIDDIVAMYHPYHEMDVSQFCDEMDRLYRVSFPERNLKRIRRIAHLSQSELAARSGVSVRTIQELEQGRKDINRAGIDTLMPLAAALSVNVESLVERVV
jgi:DNA-binding transcriptional regulator YiaG